jgi:hypothetical protein
VSSSNTQATHHQFSMHIMLLVRAQHVAAVHIAILYASVLGFFM